MACFSGFFLRKYVMPSVKDPTLGKRQKTKHRVSIRIRPDEHKQHCKSCAEYTSSYVPYDQQDSLGLSQKHVQVLT